MDGKVKRTSAPNIGRKKKLKGHFMGTKKHIHLLGLEGKMKALTSLHKYASSVLQKCSARAIWGPA